MIFSIFILGIVLFSASVSAITVDRCQNITVPGFYELTQSIVNGSYCIEIFTQNVTFDCRGFGINYGLNSTANSSAIYVEGGDNVTITSCIINAGSENLTTSPGILINRSNSTTVFNTTIETNGSTGAHAISILNGGERHNITSNVLMANGSGTNRGVSIVDALDVSIINNNITTDGLQGNVGILASSSLRAPNGTIIRNNTIRTNGSGTGFNRGIQMTSNLGGALVGTIIENNIIITNGTGSTNTGLFLRGLNNTRIANNMIETDGSSSAQDGMRLDAVTGPRFTDAVIIDNNITTNGTGNGNSGIFLSKADFSNFTGNIITTRAGTSDGVRMSGNVNNMLFTNNTFFLADGLELRTTDSASTWLGDFALQAINMTNSSLIMVEEGNATIEFLQLNTSVDNLSRVLDLRNNTVFVNSTNQTGLNGTANITLENVAFLDPTPEVDFDDVSTFIPCPASICTEHSFAGGTFIFSVNRFTTYQGNETVLACGNVGSSVNMTQDLASTGTCFNITADNVLLDCKGFAINFGRSENGSNGIEVQGQLNFTARNCSINYVNESAAGSNINLVLLNLTNSSFLINNSLNMNGNASSIGVNMQTSTLNVVANNTFLRPSANGTHGMQLVSSTNNNITHNLFEMNFSSLGNVVQTSAQSDDNRFINNTLIIEAESIANFAFNIQNSNDTLLINNNITGRGAGDVRSFVTTGSNRLLIEGNRMDVNASGNFVAGIVLDSGGSNTVVHNFINLSSDATTSGGILVISSSFNNITNNTISLDSTSEGFEFQNGANRNTLHNNSINSTNPHLIMTASGLNVLLDQTIGNFSLTFANFTVQDSDFGSINFTTSLTAAGTNFSGVVRVLNNSAFVNSTNVTGLNVSARITLEDISFTDPRPEVDLEDDGTFVSCAASVCTEESFVGSTFVFNVTRFTTYKSNESTTTCGNLAASMNMSNDLASDGTCFNITADDVLLDCKGFAINFGRVENGSNGIEAQGRLNFTAQNCSINYVNETGGNNINLILLNRTNSSLIVNNSLNMNGNASSTGMRIDTSTLNRVFNNSFIRPSANITTGILLFTAPNNTLVTTCLIST